MPRRLRHALHLAAAAFAIAACKGEGKRAQPDEEQTEERRETSPPVERGDLPIASLAELDLGDIELGGPCASYGRSVAAALAPLEEARRELEEARRARAAAEILNGAAAALRANLADLGPPPGSGPELTRRHEELVAAIRDLADACELLAAALEDPREDGDAALLRIANGVDNVAVTLAGLDRACSP